MKTILRFFLIFTLTIFATSNARSQSVFWSADYYFGCEPLMVNFFNGSDTIGTTGILFWEWHLPDMVLYTRDIPPQALPAGYHPITLKLFDDTGPVGEYTDYIDVYPDGDSFWPMDGDMLCPDKPVNFHVEDGVSWYSTTWDFGDGSVIIRDDDYVDHTYPAPGSYTVTLTVDHYCGPDTVVQTINIDGAAIPDVYAWVEGSNVICPNEPISFDAENNYTSYLWDFGDGTTSIDRNPIHFFDAQDTSVYTIVLSAKNSCGNTGTDTLMVYITNTNPADAWFGMESSEGGNLACPNTMVRFVPDQSATAYEWDLGDGTFSNERTPVNYYTQQGWYYVTLTLINGCGNEASYTDSLEIYLHYDDVPYVDFYFDMDWIDYDQIVGDTIRICPEELVEFRNNSWSVNGEELRYNWDFGDGQSSLAKNTAHVYSGPGYYPVTLTAYAPCGGSASLTKVVWVDGTLAPDVILNAVPDVICDGERVFFWFEGDNEGSRFIYDIDFGDGTSVNGITEPTDTILQTLANHIYTGVANDSFNYVFTATNKCDNTLTRNGTIRITDDPLHKPFYYVENSTTSDENQPMLNWGQRRDSSDFEFTIHLIWPDWPGISNKFAVYFWYGEFDPYSGDDPGPANGFVEFTTDQIMVGDSVKAYIPMDPLQPPAIGLAAGWTCSGNYQQGIEPEVWGMQMYYPGGQVYSLPITPYGFTDLNGVGPPIVVDADQPWDGLCASEKPGNSYYYQNSAADYIQLRFDDEMGQYELYASSDMEGFNWITDLSSMETNYNLQGDSLIYFGGECYERYIYTIVGDTIYFALDNYSCSPEMVPYLTAKPFIRLPDFGISMDDRSICPGDDVLFKVAGGISWEWHFGDGATSSLRYPRHSYALPGTYNAFLIAMNSCGRTDTIYTPVSINANNIPSAEFWWDGWDFPRLEPIQFMWGYPEQDEPGNLDFLWDFGDGTTATQMNPIHAYDRDGEYMISLTVTNNCGSSTAMNYMYIKDAVLNCEAKFADSIVSDTAYFKDISRGNITSWFWEFGDGFTSTLQDPTHVFPRDGVYFVCLSVFDSLTDCATQFCREVQIGILNCKADFVYSSNDALSTVQFTDRSTNATEWFWDFGDGYFSDEQNPVHTYPETGQYLACLSIYNLGNDCYSEFCMEVQVGTTDTNFCFADFSFFIADDNSVKFTDQSSNNITNWYWTFGDGVFLESRNPIHTYTLPGIYDVCLIVFDQFSGCTAEICKRIPVGISACNQNADFSFFVDITNNIVGFSDKSTGTITDYFWDFGDGITSTEQNPRHQYTDPGFYLVTLSVRDQESECADHTAEFLQIGTVDCRALFEYTVDGSTNNVQFYNQSQGDITEYFWNFEDGGYSVDKNPSHLYDNPGLYMVTLTVVSNDGLCMDHFLEPIQVGGISCSADFKYFIDSANNVGYFTPEAIGAITDYLWIFGDGSISTLDSPEHRFDQPGYYTVGLNTYDAVSGCMDYYEEIILIGREGIDCRADYMYMSDSLTVKFKDQSRGDIDYWIWDFGDGTFSIDQDTTRHTYLRSGHYMVCLTVINSAGIPNTYCDYIQLATRASEDCFANFYYSVDSITKTVSFKDASYGNPDTWEWDLGDGNKSFVHNPKYTYGDPDFYLVKLRINNTSSGCTSKHSELVNVAKGNLGLQADFDYEIDSSGLKAESYPVDFVGVSLGDAGKFKWSFDDGTIDTTSLNPTHVYASPGTYYVCLTIWDPVTDASSTSCDSVEVGAASVGLGAYAERDFRLGNYPNPFDDITYITYELPEASDIALAVYDQMGRMVDMLVREDNQTAGLYKIEYNARDLSSGIYILRLVIDQGVATSRMIIR